MFCSQCGATLAENSRFCTSCGSKAASSHALDQVYEAAPQSRPPTARPMGYDASNAQAAVPPQPATTASPTYYQPPQVHVTQQVQVAPPAFIGSPKSVGLALVLTFFFGPLGLFYSSVVGGIIMLIASIAFGAATWGISFFIMWPICMIWGAIAASNYNAGLLAQSRGVTQINRY